MHGIKGGEVTGGEVMQPVSVMLAECMFRFHLKREGVGYVWLLIFDPQLNQFCLSTLVIVINRLE